MRKHFLFTALLGALGRRQVYDNVTYINCSMRTVHRSAIQALTAAS